MISLRRSTDVRNSWLRQDGGSESVLEDVGMVAEIEVYEQCYVDAEVIVAGAEEEEENFDYEREVNEQC